MYFLVYEKQGESSPNTFGATGFKIASSAFFEWLDTQYGICVTLGAFFFPSFSFLSRGKGLEINEEWESGDVKFRFSTCPSRLSWTTGCMPDCSGGPEVTSNNVL